MNVFWLEDASDLGLDKTLEHSNLIVVRLIAPDKKF